MRICSGEVVAKRGGLTVIDCKACGFYHLMGLPTAKQLHGFYANDFWQHTKVGTRAQMDEQIAWWTAIYGDWLTLAQKHVFDDKSLLDVGAGYGHFLDEAERKGFEAHGIEPSADVSSRDIWRGTWEDWGLPDHQYGCISALWLIEHLPDPAGFLRWAYARLSIGGVLLATVPNDFSAAQAEAVNAGATPNYWLDETHLNYFTWSSFSNLLGRCGFRIVERSTLYPMELWIMAGQDYMRNPAIGAECHELVRMADLGKGRDQRLRDYQGLAEMGQGREIVVVAVKEG
jgi:SAM-dependent methyltransferase